MEISGEISWLRVFARYLTCFVELSIFSEISVSNWEEKCKVDVYGKVFSLHVILHGALNKNKSNKARNKQTTKDKNKQINKNMSILSFLENET